MRSCAGLNPVDLVALSDMLAVLTSDRIVTKLFWRPERLAQTDCSPADNMDLKSDV